MQTETVQHHFAGLDRELFSKQVVRIWEKEATDAVYLESGIYISEAGHIVFHMR